MSNLFGQRAACNLRMIARATWVFTAKTDKPSHWNSHLRNVYYPLLQYYHKNNKHTNGRPKVNKVFNIACFSFPIWHILCHCRVQKILPNLGYRTILFSTKSVSNQKIRDFFFIFILLSRESDRGAMHWTNPDSLRSWPCFQVFRLNFASDFFNLLLVRFHQAEIIVVKRLIQGRNNKAWARVEPLTLRSWPS